MKKFLIGSYLVITICILVIILSNHDKVNKDYRAISAGESVYKQQCVSCHGDKGKGEGLKAGTALNNQDFLNSLSDKDLHNYIKYGRTGMGMPSYRSIISEEELNNLVAFIRNWQTEEIKQSAPKVITGNPDKGVRLYQLYCQTCHGEDGAGMPNMGPALSNADYLKYTSNKQIWISTAYGRKDTGMGPSLKGLDGVRQLKSEQITDIVIYIRSLQKKQ